METCIKDLQAMGKEVLMTIIQPQPSLIMHKMHIIPTLVAEEQTFETFEKCIEYIKEKNK